MDGQRFDELARLIGSGASRRSVLKLLGGSVGGVLGGRIVSGLAQEECGVEGDPCLPSVPCCEGFTCNSLSLSCVPIQSGCLEVGSFCNLPESVFDCCPDLVCLDEVCQSRSACSGPGQPCDTGFISCCPDLDLLCMDGVCEVPGAPCNALGEACVDIADCCGYLGHICENNVCVENTCAIVGEPCATDIECCGDGVCSDGICAEPCWAEGESGCYGSGSYPCCQGLECVDDTCIVVSECVAEGDTCAADNNCCEAICCAGACRQVECCIDDVNPNDRCDDGQTCNEGICEAVTCAVEGNACAAGADCCPDFACVDGSCQVAVDPGETPGPPEILDPGGPPDESNDGVTKLPSTGVGGEVDGQNPLLGVSLAAAAMALLAARRLVETRNETEATESPVATDTTP